MLSGDVFIYIVQCIELRHLTNV